MNTKERAAQISVGSNTLLVILKLVVGVLTGSISVLSEALHSAIDLLAALIALASVRISSRPADDDHRYGHGKVENLSALVEGLLIIVAAVWIVYEAVHKLSLPHEAPATGLGLLVMGASSGINWLVSGYLFRVSKAEDSMALEADAMHLRADVWTSVGVFVGLLLVQFTGLAWLDPVAAILVAGMIVKAGWDLCVQALSPLIDARLPQEEEDEIVQLIEQHSGNFVEFHDLRTRRAGAERHVDFHLVVHGSQQLEVVHRLCDEIEGAIAERFPSASVLIHPEPCPVDCDLCQGERPLRSRMGGSAPRRLRLRGGQMRRELIGDPVR